MRILHVVPTYLPAVRYGGPIYSVHGLARAQARRGDTVQVFTTNVDGPGVSPAPLDVNVDIDGVAVRYFACSPVRRLYHAPMMARALAAQVFAFDIVHLHSVFLWPTLAAARAARAACVPYVIAPRGMLVGDLIRRRSTLAKRLWLSLFERENLARAAAVHVTSELEERELRALGLTARRFCIVPNGVDMPPSSPAAPPRAKPFVLFLGRVSWKKGLDRLIPALAHVRGVDLVVAGNDEEGHTAALRDLAHMRGVSDRVRFVGPVTGDAKWALLKQAVVFALPSYSENFGIAALEAMACGTPVVVTPDVGLADTVRETGAGLVVSGDPAAIGAAIARFLVDPVQRADCGAAGRRAARILFSWDAVAARMDACYGVCVVARRGFAA